MSATPVSAKLLGLFHAVMPVARLDPEGASRQRSRGRP